MRHSRIPYFNTHASAKDALVSKIDVHIRS